ncbi:MAG: gamma-glutamyl-gamma-aminobutyrate hydrolase family protein [Alphaproteobacteria bacterium]|nr:gamma-glutamyl-gamma-aminobutyrate hydrolase family protein [Alphaproteobacteria bacterium]
MTKIKKPIIGIVLDYETRQEKEGGYSNYPWYALRTDYSNAVANSGGVPVLIPYHSELIKHYLEYCDGFIFPGGEYDIHPSYYGEEPDPKTTISNNERTNFEISLLRKVLEEDKPMLGICAGEQLLNVVLGGTLYQDISSCMKTKINHKPGGETNQNRHFIDIREGSLLHRITGKDRYKVNSHHHQAVNKLGEGLIISAQAEDGVIEAIERTKSRFCIGVEWHPEYEKNEEDSELIKALVKHSK